MSTRVTTQAAVTTALADVDFPADKDALLATAERNGADEATIRALRGVPPVEYRSLGEVLSSVEINTPDPAERPAPPVNPIEEELGENRGS
ncbi:DUF2795 domain-containing protein [Pseudonocardia sp.]|jgi:hypothetical protein|uniref:DUF2795 domain-containing protein n=1 Tax=Pseudonocardia sp. TaxID=60912 RepID=UPI0031FD9444